MLGLLGLLLILGHRFQAKAVPYDRMIQKPFCSLAPVAGVLIRSNSTSSGSEGLPMILQHPNWDKTSRTGRSPGNLMFPRLCHAPAR